MGKIMDAFDQPALVPFRERGAESAERLRVRNGGDMPPCRWCGGAIRGLTVGMYPFCDFGHIGPGFTDLHSDDGGEFA